MPRVFITALVWGLSACAALAAGENPALKDLLQAAGSGQEPVRLRAIDTLGGQTEATPEVLETLSKQLQDSSAMVRAHAAHALGQLGPAAQPAVAALAPLIADRDAQVRRAAIRAWVRIHPGPNVSIPLLSKVLKDADPAVRTEALERLVEIGKPAVPALTEALKHQQAVYWVCLALAEIGPSAADAAPGLADVLKDNPRPEVRREAALALGSMGPGAAPAVRALTDALADQHGSVADGAAFALGRIGPGAKPAEAALTKAENSSDPLLRTVSAWALAKIEPQDAVLKQKAVALLADALKSKEPRLRHAAVHGLLDMDPTSEMVFPAIKQALDAADPESLEYALEALAAMGPPAVPALIDALHHEAIRPAVASILGHLGPAAKEATPALAEIVKSDKNVRARCESLLALGNIGPVAVAAVPAAIEAIDDPDEKVCYSACYALGKIGPAAIAGEPALEKKLNNKDQAIALAAAWALAKIDPKCSVAAPQSVPVLIEGLSDQEPKVRLEAAIALRCLGPAAKEAIPALTKALGDKDELVRDMAAQALRAVGQ